MTIELLYFDGCPGYERVLALLRQLAEETGAELTLRRVETPEQARAEHFLGSPSIRVNGRDIDPDAKQRTDYGLKCRLYRTSDGHRPLPPERWVRDAVVSVADVSSSESPASGALS
jgi:hypothetical protein